MPDTGLLGSKQAAGQHPAHDLRTNYLHALSAEIRILIRAIANDPTKNVSDMRFRWPDPDGTMREYSYATVVYELAGVDASKTPAEQMVQLGLLQSVKDQLVTRTAPATGLTIAYTSLVVGEQRRTDAESTYALARRAYGNLAGAALHLRCLVMALSVLALTLAMFAAWEATKASLGKNLLQVLEPLRAQQAVIAADRFRLEMSLDKDGTPAPVASGSAGIDERLLPLCERHRLIEKRVANPADIAGMRLDSSASIRELCGRDYVLAHEFLVAHYGLQQYQEFWPDIAGGIYAVVGRIMQPALSWLNPATRSANEPRAVSCDVAEITKPDVTKPDVTKADPGALIQRLARCGDVEYLVAPAVQVISNYTLPFIFGVIGSLLYVLLQHYGSVRATTVHPRDVALAYLRVTLGIVVAACISLLVTSYAGGAPLVGAGGVPSTGSLAGSLTLSASGLTFLAGFGAEAVFTLLQNFVARVFVLPK